MLSPHPVGQEQHGTVEYGTHCPVAIHYVYIDPPSSPSLFSLIYRLLFISTLPLITRKKKDQGHSMCVHTCACVMMYCMCARRHTPECLCLMTVGATFFHPHRGHLLRGLFKVCRVSLRDFASLEVLGTLRL